MKKQNFIVVFALVAFGFMACNNEAENGLQKTVSEDEVLQFLKFMTIQERLDMDMDMELGTTMNYVHISNDGESPYLSTRRTPGSFGIGFRFNGFGRDSMNCEGGFGVCRITPERHPPIDWGYRIIVDDGFGSILERDLTTGQFYFDILLAEPAPAHIVRESFNFHVDTNLFLETRELTGIDLVVQEGIFPLNPNLGVAGGYRIPLIVVE